MGYLVRTGTLIESEFLTSSPLQQSQDSGPSFSGSHEDGRETPMIGWEYYDG